MELLGSCSQRNLSETQASRRRGESHPATSCFSLLKGCRTPNGCSVALSALASTPTPLPRGGRSSHGRELPCFHSLPTALICCPKLEVCPAMHVPMNGDAYNAPEAGDVIFHPHRVFSQPQPASSGQNHSPSDHLFLYLSGKISTGEEICECVTKRAAGKRVRECTRIFSHHWAPTLLIKKHVLNPFNYFQPGMFMPKD